MKRIIPPGLLALLVLLLSSCQAQAQQREFKEQISQEFALTADPGRTVLAVYNINGTVSVQGYSGSKVVMEVTKTIRAADAQHLEQGKQEAFVGFTQRNDSLVAYLAGPFDSRPRNQRGDNNRGELGYRYSFDYVIKVPAQLNLRVSTINDGSVVVRDMSGRIQAHNVNGAVALTNVRGATQAGTINGSLDVSYAASPIGACSYSTINGPIRVSYPADVAADVHFKSMHGELFTDFPDVAALPLQVTQNKTATTGGTKYKLSKGTAVRLGRGGPDFRFETLNGDVTIKRKP